VSTVVEVVFPHSPIFRLRQKSLVRGIVLSLGAFLTSLLLAGFPHLQNLHGSSWQSLYSAGVLILLYSDLVIMMLIVFLVAYR
jgi:hypothetical protein